MHTYKVISDPTGRSYLQKIKRQPYCPPRRYCKHTARLLRQSTSHRVDEIHWIEEHVDPEVLNAGIYQDDEITAQELAHDAQ